MIHQMRISTACCFDNYKIRFPVPLKERALSVNQQKPSHAVVIELVLIGSKSSKIYVSMVRT